MRTSGMVEWGVEADEESGVTERRAEGAVAGQALKRRGLCLRSTPWASWLEMLRLELGLIGSGWEKTRRPGS